MGRINRERRLSDYHKIYGQVNENPLIHIYQIVKNTGISRSTIAKYLQEMYELSIISGPAVFLRPAPNYRQCVTFLKFSRPLSAFKWFKGFPNVISRSLSCGEWDLMLTSESLMDFSILQGFKECVLQDTKGVAVLSKVTSLSHGKHKEQAYQLVVVVTAPDRETILVNPQEESYAREARLLRSARAGVEASHISLLSNRFTL